MQPDWQLGADKVYCDSDKFCFGITVSYDLHVIVVFVAEQSVSALMLAGVRVKLIVLMHSG